MPPSRLPSRLFLGLLPLLLGSATGARLANGASPNSSSDSRKAREQEKKALCKKVRKYDSSLKLSEVLIDAGSYSVFFPKNTETSRTAGLGFRLFRLPPPLPLSSKAANPGGRNATGGIELRSAFVKMWMEICPMRRLTELDPDDPSVVLLIRRFFDVSLDLPRLYELQNIPRRAITLPISDLLQRLQIFYGGNKFLHGEVMVSNLVAIGGFSLPRLELRGLAEAVLRHLLRTAPSLGEHTPPEGFDAACLRPCDEGSGLVETGRSAQLADSWAVGVVWLKLLTPISDQSGGGVSGKLVDLEKRITDFVHVRGHLALSTCRTPGTDQEKATHLQEELERATGDIHFAQRSLLQIALRAKMMKQLPEGAPAVLEGLLQFNPSNRLFIDDAQKLMRDVILNAQPPLVPTDPEKPFQKERYTKFF